VVERKHLTVVIPGIGGSVLEDTARNPVWDVAVPEFLGAGREPGRLSMEESPILRPVGLIRSRRLLPGWTVVHGYDRLVRSLGQLPGARMASGHPEDAAPEANIVLFPYDFRRSVADVAEDLDAMVRGRLERLGSGDDRRVIVVAHSMGGLVARYWLGPLRGAEVCRALVTLGTPFRGAPKALHLLVNGIRPGRLTSTVAEAVGAKPAEFTQVLRGWPSMAQLLPRYPAVWDHDAQAAKYPYDLPIDWLAGPARDAYQVHTDIDEAWGELGGTAPEVDARLGWSHRTLNAARWRDGRLSVTKDAPTWLDIDGWAADRGDGTVPSFSAVPLEASTYNPSERRIRQRHGPLGSSAVVLGILEAYERYSTGIQNVRGEDAQAFIGLDLDSEYAVEVPVPVAVTLSGSPENIDDAHVSVAVRPAGRVQVLHDMAMERRGNEFVGEATGLMPGLYDLSVTVRGVPGLGDEPLMDSFAVVEA